MHFLLRHCVRARPSLGVVHLGERLAACGAAGNYEHAQLKADLLKLTADFAVMRQAASVPICA